MWVPIEDLTFEWSAGDLNVSESSARKLRDGSVFQLRPPSRIKNPPWGIFFMRFADDKVYRGVLRQILRALVPKQRRQSQLPTWQHENLLFICATKDYEQFTFAHFKGLKPERAVLSSFIGFAAISIYGRSPSSIYQLFHGLRTKLTPACG